jgi:hypothetical protein
VWLGDIPVAVIEAGTTPTISYIHPDHLNRPIAMTDDTGAFVNETIWVAFGGIHVMTGSDRSRHALPWAMVSARGWAAPLWHHSEAAPVCRCGRRDGSRPAPG